MKKIILFVSIISLGLLSQIQAYEPYETLYQDILKENTAHGQIFRTETQVVNYEALQESQSFSTLIRILGKKKPENLTGIESKIAFWINAYNIAALKLALDHYPIESITKISTPQTPWEDLPVLNIEDHTYSLLEIKCILDSFGAKKINFVLCDTTLASPDLAPEPYTAERIFDQIETQLKQFLNNPQKGLFYDQENNVLILSDRFKCFADEAEIKNFLKYYLPFDLSQTKIQYLYADPQINKE